MLSVGKTGSLHCACSPWAPGVGVIVIKDANSWPEETRVGLRFCRLREREKYKEGGEELPWKKNMQEGGEPPWAKSQEHVVQRAQLG